MLKDLVRLSRPKHWIKNVFVFMPLPFAVASGSAQIDVPRFALGLLGFCLANSAVYSFNDAYDVERDRRHPKKKNRPVASGRVSVRAALVWSLLLAVLGGAAAGFSGTLQHPLGGRGGGLQALWILLAYIGLNVFYCLRGKHIPLVDVFLLSSGFVLRVLLGCALVDVPASNWLLLCSSALALFLALAKRWGDLAKGMDPEHRPSLAGYNREFLHQAMGILTATTLISYALYCIEAEVLIDGREFLSLPFVVFGVLEYLRLVHVQDDGGSPVDTLLSSPKLVVCGIAWAVAAIWSVRLF